MFFVQVTNSHFLSLFNCTAKKRISSNSSASRLAKILFYRAFFFFFSFQQIIFDGADKLSPFANKHLLGINWSISENTHVSMMTWEIV